MPRPSCEHSFAFWSVVKQYAPVALLAAESQRSLRNAHPALRPKLM
jgi:hypothetical protein